MTIRNIVLARLSHWGYSCRSHPQDYLPPFSLGFAASVLKENGLSVSIIDTLVEKSGPRSFSERIKKEKPDLLILDVASFGQEFLNGLGKYSGYFSDIKTWCMGHLASSSAEEIIRDNRFIDGCIVGEPEDTVKDLVACLNNNGRLGSVRGIAFFDKEKEKVEFTGAREFIHDLDRLPPIDYRLLKMERYRVFSAHIPSWKKLKWGFLLTSRGCVHNCIYCSATLRQSYGRLMRFNSVDEVVKQMEGLIKGFGVNAIAFQDDNFTFDKERTISICRKIIEKKLKIRWVVQTRADYLDGEIISWLKKAGCSCIGLGIESGSDRVLKLLNKGQTKESIYSAVRQIKEAGISVIAFFMLGSPTETYAEAMDTFRLAKELKPQLIQVAFFTPYPGSAFYEKLDKNKFNPSGAHHYNSFRLNFSGIPDKELLRIHKMFYLKYYFCPGFMLSYLKDRALYAFVNNQELKLFFRTIRYFLLR